MPKSLSSPLPPFIPNCWGSPTTPWHARGSYPAPRPARRRCHRANARSSGGSPWCCWAPWEHPVGDMHDLVILGVMGLTTICHQRDLVLSERLGGNHPKIRCFLIILPWKLALHVRPSVCIYTCAYTYIYIYIYMYIRVCVCVRI